MNRIMPETFGEGFDIRAVVRERYGAIANRTGESTSCCSPQTQSSCCCSEEMDENKLEQVKSLYQDENISGLPVEVTEISLGCGDPVSLAALLPGQIVLDLGSGGGIDCFLAARRVDPGGKVIGVDMTPAMVEKARMNKNKIGVENVEFRLGEIEHLPVGDETVDVIISNCVINLSPDKAQVLREAYRVLKPGGRLAISDIVSDGPLPEAVKNDLSAWVGCIGGAVDFRTYIGVIRAAGFEEVEITPQYWGDEMINVTAGQPDPVLRNEIETVRNVGGSDIVTQDGVEGKRIQVADDAAQDFVPQKAIFSAKIRAVKK